MLKTKKGKSGFSTAPGGSRRQHEAKFRIDLEASHQHHGDKGQTSQDIRGAALLPRGPERSRGTLPQKSTPTVGFLLFPVILGH